MIRILSINIRSISKKIDELTNTLLQNKIDFAFIQETQHRERLPNIWGYTNVGIARKKLGVGVALYTNKKYSPSPIYSICSNEFTKIECVGQIVKIADQSLTMYSIYIPPTTSIEEMNVLHKIDFENSIVCGDFNSHSTLWSNGNPNCRGKFLEDILKKKSTIINNTKQATLKQTNKKHTTPDLVLVGKNLNYLEFSKVWIGSEISSDHMPIITELNTNKRPVMKKYVYSTKFLDQKKFENSIETLRLKHFCSEPQENKKGYSYFVEELKRLWQNWGKKYP